MLALLRAHLRRGRWVRHLFPPAALALGRAAVGTGQRSRTRPDRGRWLRRGLRLEPLEARLALDSTVVLNEIMYNPAGPDDGLEWIELYNQMAVDMDLSGWSLADGVRYTMPPGTILPGGAYLVIAADPQRLQTAVGVAAALGPFAGRLANGGERIELRSNTDRVMDVVRYNDDLPWPVGADGSGASLAKVDPGTASQPATNWTASGQVGGTPGSINFIEETATGRRVDQLIGQGAAAAVRVPSPADAGLGSRWTQLDFDAAGWTEGPLAVGFDADVSQTAGQAAGLLRYYPIEGDAQDMSGNQVDGVIKRATFSADVPARPTSAQALDLNGVNSRLKIFDTADPASYTISVWVKFDTVRQTSIILRAGLSGPGFFSTYQLRVNRAGQFEHHTIRRAGFLTVTGTTVVEPDRWYHVVATAQRDGLMRLYVNGVREGAELSIDQPLSNGDRWIVGARYDRTSEPLDGQIDDLAIWSGALTAAEIARLYEGESPISITGYVGQIGTDVQQAMLDRTASAWLRTEFDVLPGVAYDQLTLRVQADDGFVAYLNGTRVAQQNAPEVLSWNAAATGSNPDGAALVGELFDISDFADQLRSGRNVLAIHGLNRAAADRDFLIGAQLSARVAEGLPARFPVAINEIAGDDADPFWIELVNRRDEPVEIAGLVLASTNGAGAEYVFPDLQPPLAPGDFLVLDQQQLGWRPDTGDRVFLYAPRAAGLLDAVRVESRPRGRDGGGRWQYPAAVTPGSANRFTPQTDIVINEIMYHHRPFYPQAGGPDGAGTPWRGSDEEWLELTNRSATDVIDLSGWRLDDAVEFDFPAGTMIGPGQFLVVAKDPAALAEKYPDVFQAGAVLGPFSGRLANSDEQILLLDAAGNVADQVHYYDGGRWPAYADGGGASLELRDPRADNRRAEAWAASDEAGRLGRSPWQRVSFNAVVEARPFDPVIYFQDFVLGLLSAGEVLLDNISVVEDPGGANIELIENGDFQQDLVGAAPATWRIQGTHERSRVVGDPEDPANKVLHLIADGPLSDLSNHAETTLADNARITVGTTYRFSYDARWLAGSPQLHTQLQYRAAARTVTLALPERSGTPGGPNSVATANIGPTFAGLQHAPVVPTSAADVTVSVVATDPDGVASVTLMVAVDGLEPLTATPMTAGPDGLYTATIPAQADGAVVQFYVLARDLLGEVSTFPAAGAESRALLKVVDGFTRDPLRHDLQLIMTAADVAALYAPVNMMDNQFRGATLVVNGREVFYDVGARLKGSMFTRDGSDNTGFTIRLQPDRRFRGVHESITLDQRNEREILIKHLINQAGVLGGTYDDVVNLRPPSRSGGGPTLLSMARHTDVFLDSQFANGGDGALFKMDAVRVPITTVDGTPQGLKLYLPIDLGSGFDIADMGDDKEAYRWSYPIRNARDRDDYSRLIDLAQAFSLDGPQLEQAVNQVIDVDQWMKAFAMMSLGGIGDVYSQGYSHNLKLYVRPADNKVLPLPWDWDFTFNRPATAPLYGTNRNLAKVIELPANKRLFLGHLKNMIDTVFNADYMAYWTDHYGTMLGENYSVQLNAIRNRAEFVMSQLPAAIPFEITSAGGEDFAVAEPTARIEGRGWIDVRAIRLAGAAEPLDVTWIDGQRWQATVPLASGSNVVSLEAVDHQGEVVGADAVTVTAFTVQGDLNGSGGVDRQDVGALVLALRSPAAYERYYGIAAALAADLDGDGDFDFDDIDDFVALLAGPAAAAAPLPAPPPSPAPADRPLPAAAGAAVAGSIRPALQEPDRPRRVPNDRLQDAVWAPHGDWRPRP